MLSDSNLQNEIKVSSDFLHSLNKNLSYQANNMNKNKSRKSAKDIKQKLQPQAKSLDVAFKSASGKKLLKTLNGEQATPKTFHKSINRARTTIDGGNSLESLQIEEFQLKDACSDL